MRIAAHDRRGPRARRRRAPARAARSGSCPTMGAFHAGHEALMRAARERCDEVVVSLFVNPAQFDEAADLDAYPRTEAADAAIAAALGVDVAVRARRWPRSTRTASRRRSASAAWASVLEGAERGPAHFDGVCTVVCKLFTIVAPDVAYFGQKDAQQVVVIRRMVRDLDLPVRIETVPTVREPDGLALSSRNARLGPGGPRARARAAPRAWTPPARRSPRGEPDPRAARGRRRAPRWPPRAWRPSTSPSSTPTRSSRWNRVAGRVLVVVAARVGPARLIDNVLIDTEQVATRA